MSEMQLSIVIVSWNVKEEMRECLCSIEKHRPQGEFEVIVVDNASTDGTADAIRREFPDVTVLANTDNRGFSAANNQGICLAQGRSVLLLNPDCMVHEGALDAMIDLLERDQTIGACGPHLVDTEGKLYRSVGHFPSFRAMLLGKTAVRSLGLFRRHYRRLIRPDIDYGRRADVDQLSGAAILVRHSVLEQIGGMDEAFFLYYEDVDLCLRIRQAGWRMVYAPEAVITHIGGQSTKGVSTRKRMLLYRSLFILLRKHRGRRATGLFGLLFKPGVLAGDVITVMSGSLAWLLSLLTRDTQRRSRAVARISESMLFLRTCSWEFMFRL